MLKLVPVAGPVQINSIYRMPANPSGTTLYADALKNDSGRPLGLIAVWVAVQATTFIVPVGRGDLMVMDIAHTQQYELLDTFMLNISSGGAAVPLITSVQKLMWVAPLGLCLQLDSQRTIAGFYPNADVNTSYDAQVLYCALPPVPPRSRV